VNPALPVMTLAVGSILAGIAGTLVGSFLNVVGYRVPRGESVVRPASRCPSCGTPIKPYDNVPVISWIVLRGRCRSCGTGIAARYPLVELVTGLLCAAVVLDRGADGGAWLGLAFVVLLVPVVTIDLDHRIIPNVLTGIGAVAAIVLVLATEPSAAVEHVVAAVAAGGFLLVAAIAYPSGMGMGDVKLAAVMGLFLGREVGAAMLVALVAGSVVGALVIAHKGAREGRKTAIPFGPFLALGGVVALFVGDDLVAWYLARFV
jgi:leader peptidase (prepilin peptidase) / N-methyltransferase